jgi:hypothetical protein
MTVQPIPVSENTVGVVPSTEESISTLHSRRVIAFLAIVLAAFVTMSFGPFHGTASAASAPAVNQCNGTDNVGGQAVACTVNVTNNLDLTTGHASSSISGTDCHGAAHAPPTCIPWTAPSNQLVSSVTQCNGSGSGGGGTVTCSVNIVNNITGSATVAPATVNQCNSAAQGGGTQPTLVCSPIGVTTNATFTQCNGSGNGGGGTVRVQCNVGPSTQSSAIPISVNQCVGSGNGGGGTVTCFVSETNHVIAGSGTTGGTGGTTGGTGGSTGGTGGTTGTGGSSGTTGTGGSGGSGSVAKTPAGGTVSKTPGGGTVSKTPGGSNGLGTVNKTPGRGVPLPPTGKLANTGSDTAAVALMALVALSLGTALVLVARRSVRRHARNHQPAAN